MLQLLALTTVCQRWHLQLLPVDFQSYMLTRHMHLALENSLCMLCLDQRSRALHLATALCTLSQSFMTADQQLQMARCMYAYCAWQIAAAAAGLTVRHGMLC